MVLGPLAGGLSTAFLLAFIPALVLGLVVTYRPRRWLDASARGLAYVAIGTPTFWLALLALIVGFVRTAGIQFFAEIELAVLYLIAAAVLLVRPTGLFGRA